MLIVCYIMQLLTNVEVDMECYLRRLTRAK